VKKNIVVNLIVCLFCLFHLVFSIILKNSGAEIIPVIQYILVIGITLFSIYINYKWDTEEEFMNLFDKGITCKILLYVFTIIIVLVVISLKSDSDIKILDAFGISVFNVFDVDNENIIETMVDYDNIFHFPFLGFRYFHRTVGGRICMAQTYLLLLIGYEMFIKNRIKKVKKQDIFYKSEK